MNRKQKLIALRAAISSSVACGVRIEHAREALFEDISPLISDDGEAENADLRAEIERLTKIKTPSPDRLERIATAAMQGMLAADPDRHLCSVPMGRQCVYHAMGLIEALDGDHGREARALIAKLDGEGGVFEEMAAILRDMRSDVSTNGSCLVDHLPDTEIIDRVYAVLRRLDGEAGE